MTCDKCGAELVISAWPWCPHEVGTNAIEPDTVIGGFWAENGFREPTFFESHSAHEAALAERGLMIKAKWAGPEDKHLKRWDAPTAKTLDDARVLLSRGAVSRDDRLAELEAAKAEFPVTVTTIPWSTHG